MVLLFVLQYAMPLLVLPLWYSALFALEVCLGLWQASVLLQ